MSSSSSALTPASVPALSPKGSPSATRRTDTTASAVAAAATASLTTPASTTSASLKGAEPPVDPLVKQYNQAHQALDKGEFHEARALFFEIINTYGEDESHLLDRANCNIGIVYTYNEVDPAAKLHIIEAKRLLDASFEKTCSDDVPVEMNDEETISVFVQMKKLYNKVAILVPEVEDDIHTDIKAKIEHCTRRLPVLVNFYAELDRAQEFLTKNEARQASAIIEEVLPNVYGDGTNDDPEFFVARAMGNLKLAFIYSTGDRHYERATQAQVLTFAAYARKDELYTNDKAKARYLKAFITLFDSLSKLFAEDSPIHRKSLKNLEECQKELDSLSAGLDSSKTPEDSNIDSDPAGDYWKPARIFLAFTIAAAVIVGAAFLGRRFITRLN